MSQRSWSPLAFMVALVVTSIAAIVTPPSAYAETAGVIYVVDYNGYPSPGMVFRVDPSQPANSNQTLVSSGQHFGDPVGIALAQLNLSRRCAGVLNH